MMLNRARTTITGITAAAMLAATSVVAVPAAQAASPGAYNGEAQIILASHRSDDWRWKRHRHRDNDFPAALFGFGAGAIVGSLLAQPRYYAAPSHFSDADAYCASKFKTYKPWTGTYRGYDGYEHPCP
jgi:Ni/Co efflux regulator RcnB